MTKYFFQIAILLIVTTGSLAGQNMTISGYIKDAKTGEALIGASVYVTTLQTGTAANVYGFYSLTIPQRDSVGIVFSYVGYQPQIKKITVKENVVLNIFLESRSDTMNEVVITSDSPTDNIEKPQMGVIDIPIEMIKELPAILGEPDVLKVIQLLPGVQSGAEGTTGFYVRGGNSDQNLVQLDGATVYNPNHLFGLFGTFNTRALNDVVLIKGGFPAQYGGRLSSILDITMKEGNDKKFSGGGGLGLISSSLTLEGPIKKEKGSFIVSGRRSYLDYVLKPFLPKTNQTTYYFYDVNAKANWAFSGKDRIYLSFFKGLDNASYTEASSINYGIRFGNSTATLRWNHVFTPKLFANTALIYNTYLLNISTVQGNYYAQLYSGINDATGRIDFEYFPNTKHTILFGAIYTYHTFVSDGKSAKVPRNLQLVNLQTNAIPPRYSTEGAVYVNDEFTISKRIAFSGGVRAPFFVTSNVSYYRVEPRAILKVSIDSSSSIKASYTVMNQFLHVVPSSTASLPTDIWIPSSKLTKPELSEQLAVGYYRNLFDDKLETNVELYYKTMYNQVAFKEGTQLLEQGNIDNQLVYGKGWSYGAEIFIRKKTGKLKGWIAYTLSWTNQQFNDLNYGKPFPFKYDHRHNLSIVATYALSKHWTLSADFVFSTGGAYTLPSGRFSSFNDGSLYDGIYYAYDKRNNYRMNPYHRLDVGATYKKSSTIFKRKYESEWIFSIYNVYSHRNPYFVYLVVDPVTSQSQAKQVSLLPIIPSVTYNFNF